MTYSSSSSISPEVPALNLISRECSVFAELHLFSMELQRNKYVNATFLEDDLEISINIENICYPLIEKLHF